MKVKLFVGLFTILFLNQNIQAQEKLVSQFKIGLCKGFEETIVQKKAKNQNIDFLNYVYRYPLLLEDSYTGFRASIWFRNRLEINFQTQMQYHLNLKNIRLAMQYYPNNNIGYSFGFYRYEQVITGLNDFPFIDNNGALFILNDLEIKQRFFDRAVFAGIAIRKTIQDFSFEGKLNGGACLFSPISFSFYVKQKDNNLIQRIEYQSTNTWYGFILPEFTAGYDIYRTAKRKYGIEMKAVTFIANRAADYNKTVYTWTTDNQTTVHIVPESHLYFRYEWDLGIYMKW